MKKKNTKWDLIWIIPYIIGSLAILWSAIYYLFKLKSPSLGLMFFIFNVALVLVVLELGFIGLRKSLDELREVLHK